MEKVDLFSQILDSLKDDGKDKLLASAQGLIEAQKVVRAGSARFKPTERKSNKMPEYKLSRR